MPSTPTTKSQVQAYQFVLRRMQSALVRRDAVMLHDPMRTHSRATIVGVVLGAIGLVGFLVWGLISPQAAAPESDNIVIGQPSGTVYVVTGNPKMLIPTFNLASARLLLMAQKQQSAQGGTPAASGGQAAAGAAEVKTPSVVSDDQLKDIPRGRLHGIPNGPQLLPTAEQRISDNWAVCNRIGLDMSLPVPTSINKMETTVVAGERDLGRELGQNESILAQADDGSVYLVYRLQASPNQPNANAVRARVDPGDRAVVQALGLQAPPRRISMALLNAIPQVGELRTPQIDGIGQEPNFSMSGLKVGDVFFTQPLGEPVYYAVMPNGIQEISAVVAEMIRYSRSNSPAPPRQLRPDAVPVVNLLQKGDDGYLAVEDYPQQRATVLDPVTFPVSCLGWNLVGSGSNEDLHTSVFVGTSVPVPGPKGADGSALASLSIGQPSPDGTRIDKFYMRPGFGAVVRSTTSKDTFGTGPIEVVSDRGVRYGVPDVATASGLGLDGQRPAPESILRLLPTGASLNTQDVLRTYDTVPSDPNMGTFETPAAGG